MGHKINPLIFRLGKTKNWQFNLKKKPIISYLIYQLISNQFLRYTIRYFNYERRRNTRHSTGLVIMKGEKQNRQNNFIKRSMLFSHMYLGLLHKKVFLNCYLFDYRVIDYKRYKVREFKTYNQLYSNSYMKWKAYHKYYKKRTLKTAPYRFIRVLYYLVPNFWFFNLTKSNQTNYQVDKFFFKLTKIWLRLFGKINRNNKKINLFYLSVLNKLICMLFTVLNNNNNLLRNRLQLIQLQINLMIFNFKISNSKFFSQFFASKYFVYKAVSKSILQNLNSLLSTNLILNIKYLAIRERKMSSSLLTNLILIKLGQYYSINSIIYPLVNWIKRHKNVLGYRIIISGRLTRRERASHMIKSGLSMPLSKIKLKLDYHQDVKIMKFGMVGIKFYIHMRKKLRNSYYYFNFINVA